MKTLGDYRDFCVVVNGENGQAIKFFDDKIKQQSRDEVVIADETQMIILIASLMKGDS